MDFNDPKIQEKSNALAQELIEAVASGSATAYSYKCRITTGVVGAGYVHVQFSKGDHVVAEFKGVPILGVGGYVGWGTAWSNAPVENMKGKKAGFTMEFVGVLGGTAHIQITNLESFTCNGSTGGIGIGAGVSSGPGEFF
jgi:hypothetical protein